MRAGGIGRVVASQHPGYPEGALVQGLLGWQDYAVLSDAAPRVRDARGRRASRRARSSASLGMTGLTAYVGMHDIGRPQAGETVVVSAAAGAVGSVAGQIAKIEGARVVGIAGGPEKCAMLTGELGFDAAVDYKAPDWREQLKAATPDGIDVDFENVGGEIMDAVFARLNIRARVALCGLISGYNDAEPPPGPRAFGRILTQPRADPGLHRARPLRPGPGGRADPRRVDGRGPAQGAGDRRRGLRAAAARAEHAVRRRERREAGRPDLSGRRASRSSEPLSEIAPMLLQRDDRPSPHRRQTR